MRRLVAVCLLALGLLVAPLAAAAAPGVTAGIAGVGPADESGASAQDGGNQSVSPGERVAGAIGSEGAALDGEVSERSFGVQLAAAETNESAATIVADRLDRIEQRLDALETKNASLAASYENGSITYGAYAAQAAAVESERASLARQLNASQTAAGGLPADVLADNGVDAGAIDELRTRASDLGGQQVRELARSIAGSGVGNGIGPPGNGPGAIPGLGGDDSDGVPGNGGNGSNAGDGPGSGQGDSSDGDSSGEGDDTSNGDDATSDGDSEQADADSGDAAATTTDG